MGILLAFITLLTWALSDLLVKHALGRQSIWFVNFWTQCLGGTIILAIGLSLGKVQGISVEAILWSMLLAVINFFGMILFYKAIHRKGISLSLPIIYSWSVPATILSMIFLSQYPSFVQWSGIAIILVGLFLINVTPHAKVALDSGTLFAFLSMLIWGIFYFIITEPTALYGQWILAAGIKLGSGVLTLLILIKKQEGIQSLRPTRILWVLATIGALDALGLVALTTGLPLSTTAIMTGITSTTPVIVAFFGILLFKEKVTRQQALGIGVTVAGLILLVF